ncbi:hypothetical protein [Streptomyces sp. NPDC091383]|uniref:hypothetical protein n=1 Tax=Streptomyces sp. NPDC091383 TaxID=3365996 RepID=UPI0038013E03
MDGVRRGAGVGVGDGDRVGVGEGLGGGAGTERAAERDGAEVPCAEGVAVAGGGTSGTLSLTSGAASSLDGVWYENSATPAAATAATPTPAAAISAVRPNRRRRAGTSGAPAVRGSGDGPGPPGASAKGRAPGTAAGRSGIVASTGG